MQRRRRKKIVEFPDNEVADAPPMAAGMQLGDEFSDRADQDVGGVLGAHRK